MRKANSNFMTAFVSEAGKEIANNDYFGFVEMDDLAIYVVADSIHSHADSEAAKKAIQSVVLKFHENPSMKKRALRSYLKAANKELLRAGHRHRLKASITIVATNYQKMRYAYVGNTRMYLYRGRSAVERSKDMSLSQELLDKERISTDKLAKHEERHNLRSYLGQEKGFEPFVSKKIKLKDSDIITMFTKGIWENLDDAELFDVFSEATDEPQKSVDDAEEMLLSKQPKDLGNYTLVSIFVNKIFTDPKRAKRIKRIVTISVIVLVILIIVGVILFFYFRNRRIKREDMNDYYASALSYIEDYNFPRAAEDADKAYDLATSLRDKDMQSVITRFQRLVESVSNADEQFAAGNYAEAQEYYKLAQEHSRQADNYGLSYIESALAKTESYISFYETMEQADRLMTRGNYREAVEIYAEARQIASSLYFTEGKTLAIDGMDRAYDSLFSVEEQQGSQAQAYSEQVLAATDLVAQGDESYAGGDYETALVHYLLARDKYDALEDDQGIMVADAKITLANQRIGEVGALEELAVYYVSTAGSYLDQEMYANAKHYYNLARQLYQDLEDDRKISEMDILIESCDSAEQAAAELAAIAQAEAEAAAAAAAEENFSILDGLV